MAKWEVVRKSRMSGSSEYDASAKCLPLGMPNMMVMFYGMEVMQNKDKITMFSELNDSLRRVYLDGRKPSQKVLDDPTYAGYSTGHWEGDTLVVDTVALHPGSFIDGMSPHSDQMTVHETIRFAEPTLLEDHVTVTDPKALTKPWENTYRYRRAKPGKDELREFGCPEGLSLSFRFQGKYENFLKTCTLLDLRFCTVGVCRHWRQMDHRYRHADGQTGHDLRF
jgi:hypothetical protein